MDESLLADNEDRCTRNAEEEDELLWNELKDDDRAPSFIGSSHQVPVSSARASGSSPGVAPLPSLRVNVHLPAISTLFRDVLDTLKGVLPGAQRQATGQREAAAATAGRVSPVPDRYGRVPNLDAFLITLYNYYYHKGFWSIVVVELVSLTTGLLSVVLSSFLLSCVQWKPLLECHRHPERRGCAQDMEHYVSCRADTNGLVGLIGAFYFAMFLLYWVSRLFQLVGTLRDTKEMETFYKERLGIHERQVQTVAWDEVVTRVLHLVQGANDPVNMRQLSSYKLQIDPALLSSAHDFARRIMRRDNYLIAIMNHSLFERKKLLPTSLQFLSTSHIMCSRNMEANLNICLLDQMFDAELNLAPSVIHNVEMLKKRFVIAGVLNFVLAPFILLYRLSRFFFLTAQEWQTNRVYYFGTRRWSAYAIWRFREYNELPHVLDARMARSYALADRYLGMFPAGSLAIVAGGISFCASSIMAVLVLVSLLEESVLLQTTLFGHELLWYLTVSAGVFALSRSFTSSASPFLVNGDCEEAMMQVSAETHYFAKEWRGQCHSFEVRDAFTVLFPFKAVLFAEEVVSVFLAPYILCVSLPRLAREILLFLRSHSIVHPSTRAVCRFAEFDFKEYGNDAKMESSFINFKQNHPKWVGDREGEALMHRLGKLKEEEMEKSMRMGDTMMYSSPTLSMSQQLMQSQAIHNAMGGGPMSGYMPQDNEFYWLEKLHQQGRIGELDLEGMKGYSADSISASSVGSP
uniref:Autophagy-related protein 9 n=1 Tax=Hyaloperonospora arabidopsidis (strain Emoy2) TaxID=559515 RepID=M4B1N5_HYAAE